MDGRKSVGYERGSANVENGQDRKDGCLGRPLHVLHCSLRIDGRQDLPSVQTGFLAADLLDEIFVTIAPKIVGNRAGATLTMVEGHLFPAEEVKNLRLLSVGEVEDEVYLRYRVLERRED